MRKHFVYVMIKELTSLTLLTVLSSYSFPFTYSCPISTFASSCTGNGYRFAVNVYDLSVNSEMNISRTGLRHGWRLVRVLFRVLGVFRG
jgi:hypothetical protein